MELQNVTQMQAGYNVGMQPDGRELLIVVVKGTFTIPEAGETSQPAEQQVPLLEGDVFTGEPGFSAPVYESDYAPHKPRCDVLLNGRAYAPGGVPAKRVPVSLRVASLSKSFDVVGHRFWQNFKAGDIEPFTVMPMAYDNAYGGVDQTDENQKKHRAYSINPVGVGFHSQLKKETVEGRPLPNTEETGTPVVKPGGPYRPMAFGAIGRSWSPRVDYAGTYDDNWKEKVFPFLPQDFNQAYYQSAPSDQQVTYLQGGEEVVLENLTPRGITRFRVPSLSVPVAFFLKNGETHKIPAVADTLILEPEANRLIIIWRASLALKKNIFEVEQVLIGKKSRGWWRARESGKSYYGSLGELAREKRGETEKDGE